MTTPKSDLDYLLEVIEADEPPHAQWWMYLCVVIRRAIELRKQDRNQADAAPSDAVYKAPTPRGSLPNNLGDAAHPADNTPKPGSEEIPCSCGVGDCNKRILAHNEYCTEDRRKHHAQRAAKLTHQDHCRISVGGSECTCREYSIDNTPKGGGDSLERAQERAREWCSEYTQARDERDAARAELADHKTAHEKGPLGSDIPTDYKAAMNFHADRADKYMAERDALLAERDAARADLKEVVDILRAAEVACDEWELKNGDHPHRGVKLADRIRVNAGLLDRVGKV